jgi:hypothetical protein
MCSSVPSVDRLAVGSLRGAASGCVDPDVGTDFSPPGQITVTALDAKCLSVHELQARKGLARWSSAIASPLGRWAIVSAAASVFGSITFRNARPMRWRGEAHVRAAAPEPLVSRGGACSWTSSALVSLAPNALLSSGITTSIAKARWSRCRRWTRRGTEKSIGSAVRGVRDRLGRVGSVGLRCDRRRRRRRCWCGT